jgi:hypothetical protein
MGPGIHKEREAFRIRHRRNKTEEKAKKKVEDRLLLQTLMAGQNLLEDNDDENEIQQVDRAEEW